MGLSTFAEALEQSAGTGKRPHVLLGNGFSRACRNDIFAYEALFDRADFSALSGFAQQAFSVLRTQDFEIVMRALRSSALLVKLYRAAAPDLAEELERDANGLRDVLVRAIAGSHPDRPGDIVDHQYAACRTFLANFDRIFTLNYDLLLYWALMNDEVGAEVPCDDGFRKPEDNYESEYVSWEPENTYKQNLYYLHGGLHIFDKEGEVCKYTWSNTGVPLIEQIRDALERGLYPLFVAEGESREKIARIRHSGFLSKSERSLFSVGGPLFVYGHSLADNDAHVFRAIVKSKVTRLYISIYGDPASDGNQSIQHRARRLADRRRGRPLTIDFYDAESAAVWG